MGLKEPRERSSKPMDIMRYRKVRMSHSKSEVMKQESKGLVKSLWASYPFKTKKINVDSLQGNVTYTITFASFFHNN